MDKKVKENRKAIITEMVLETNNVPLNIMRKVLGMEKKTYINDIIPWADKFGYSIQGDILIIPKDKVEKFIEMLMWEKPFENKKVEE